MKDRKLFYFNAGFDRKMGGQPVSPKLQRAIDAMSLLLIPALSSEDAIYSPLTIHNNYYDYLHSCGISGAQLTQDGNGCNSGDAWGVDDEAKTFFHSQGVPFETPTVELVKELNSRSFAHSLSQELTFGIPHSTKIESIEQFEQFAKEHSQFVIKPLFGNAGSGFIYSESNLDSKASVSQLLINDGSCIAEPWLEKTLDIATLLQISQSGEVAIQGHHRNVSNRAGAFYANIMVESDPLIAPYHLQLHAKATELGRALHAKGYFGPVGLDSILYKDVHGDERLTFGIDLNVRNPISTISYAIRNKLPKKKAFMYRFIARRRLKALTNYDELHSILGSLAYSRVTGSGVILATPLTYKNEFHQELKPDRFAFVLQADTLDELLFLDERLRKAILKQPSKPTTYKKHTIYNTSESITLLYAFYKK